MSEHPVQQKIDYIVIDNTETSFSVGRNGVSRIEACTKSGMNADVPYVRVWSGDLCIAEFCQHSIIGVYFSSSFVKKEEEEFSHEERMRCIRISGLDPAIDDDNGGYL